MLGALVNLGIWILGLFGFGKPKSDIATVSQAGEDQGQAEQKASDEAMTIEDQNHVIATQQEIGTIRPPSDSDAIGRLRDGSA